MIKQINESLFKQKTEKRDGDHGEFYLTSFKSAVKTPNPNIKGAKGNALTAKNIISVMHTEENNFNQNNTKVDIFPGKGSNTILRISQGDNKYDTDVYLLAVPFSGIIVPIPESDQFRIYRGVTIRAAKRTIEFNGEKFNKIAFLVMVLNPGLFNENSKHYQDHLDFVIETYNLEDTEDKDVKKTIKTTHTITFYPDKDAEYKTVSEEVDPIDSEVYKGQKVFPLYTAVQDKKNFKGKKSDNKEPSKNDSSEQQYGETSENEEAASEYKSEPIGTPVIPPNKSLDDMLNEVKKVERDNRRTYDNRINGKKKKKRKKH